jgi:hypothetical protein
VRQLDEDGPRPGVAADESHGQVLPRALTRQKVLLDLEEVLAAVDVAQRGDGIGRAQARRDTGTKELGH